MPVHYEKIQLKKKTIFGMIFYGIIRFVFIANM